MARTPVTRTQLDAYRFGQRRLESALARRDPVPLHEEVRGQRRVVVTGLALAMLSLVAMFGYAKLTPRPSWQAQQVVVGKQSGRLFAVIHQPDRLVPVANLAAARLVLHAARRGASAAETLGGPRGDDSGSTATPVPVDDRALDTAPRTASAAVPGAAATLPAPDAPPVPARPWALCDSQGSGGRVTATMIADPAPSTPLPSTGGLLLAGPDGQTYLVLGVAKHRIEAPVVLAAYDLRDHPARPVSAALLATIPDGPPLDALAVSGAGRPVSWLAGHAVGDVVRVVVPGQPDRLYLVLAGGVREISAPVAALVRAGLRADVSQPPESVRLEQINAAPRVAPPELDRYPAVLPRIIDPAEAGTVCWQWGPNGVGGTLTTAAAPPVPAGRTVTQLAQSGRPGARLDAVSLPAGGALVVCAVSSAHSACPGGQTSSAAGQDPAALWLVSETGVGYPIADAETASALGVTSAVPAPADALRTLPAGPTLDVAQAQRTVDVLVAAP